MEKIKIGFIVNNLVIGGVSKVVIELCNHLDTEKYEIYLISLSKDLEMLKKFPLKSNIQVLAFDYKFESNYRLSSYIIYAFSKKKTENKSQSIIDEISELKLDIIHFHTLPRQLMLGVLIKKRRNVQLVFTDHSLRISKNDYKWYIRILLSLAYRRLYKHYHLIAVSKTIFNYIKYYRLKGGDKKLKLLENSIRIKDFNFKEQKKDLLANQLIYISRINDLKGQDTLIKAWKMLANRKADKLILVGPDETNGRIAELAKNESTIEFTGAITNVIPLLRTSTIGVFPSLKEGLPLSLLEMMAAKLPIIVSDIPELTSIIEDKKEGLWFKANDAKDLKSKVEYLLTNKKIAEKYGKNARKKVEIICKNNAPIPFHEGLYAEITTKRIKIQ